MNLKPETLFGKVLEKTFCFKLDKGLVTKGQEIEQAKSIFNRQEVASLLPNRKRVEKEQGLRYTLFFTRIRVLKIVRFKDVFENGKS